VTALRRLCRSHAGLAVLVVALALMVRVLVPAGFMPTVANGTITVSICTGYGPMQMDMKAPGRAADDMGQGHKAQQPCAFFDLAMPGLPGADPILLAVALAFIIAVAFLATPALALRRERHAWPPLRGPPLF
jgi:Na+/H+-translocating membrane pyrophosphatase